MRAVRVVLLLAGTLGGCAGAPEGTPSRPSPPADAKAGDAGRLLLPDDPLTATRDAFRAHPERVRLLVVVSPT